MVKGVPLVGFLQGKTVIVTGGAGFLGRSVCQRLSQENPARIVVPRSSQYDLRDKSAIVRLLGEVRPDVTIHLAAVVGGIGANRTNPGRYFYENAMMGIQLLEEARLAGVGKVVTVGTICSYPKFATVPFRECEIWDGYPEETNAPYGLAKKMLLVQAQAYRMQYGMNIVSLLPVNLYGPGDNFDLESSHVIPAMIRKMIAARDAGQPFVDLWGTGAASREFLFVRDAADGIVRATEAYNHSDPVNLGSGHEVTVRHLAETIARLCRFTGQLRWDASRPDGQPRRCLDTTRALEQFGFHATTGLESGLEETIAWWEAQRSQIPLAA